MVENNKMKVPEDHGRKVNEQIQHLLKTTNEHGQKLNHFNSYLEAIIIMSNANSTCLFSVSYSYFYFLKFIFNINKNI